VKKARKENTIYMKMIAISQMPHNLANSAVSWPVDRKIQATKEIEPNINNKTIRKESK